MPNITNKFQSVITKDHTSTLLQQEISRALDPISNNPVVSGVYRTSSVTALDSDVPFNHGLGVPSVSPHVVAGAHPLIPYISPNNSDPQYNPTPKTTTLLRFSSSVALPLGVTAKVFFTPQGLND